MKRNKLFNKTLNLCMILLLIITQAIPAWGFEIDKSSTVSIFNTKPDKDGIHENITSDAIRLVTPNANPLLILNLQRGVENIDIAHVTEDDCHFDNNSFQKGFSSIQKRMNIALQYASNNPEFLNPHQASLERIANEVQTTLEKAATDTSLAKIWAFPTTGFLAYAESMKIKSPSLLVLKADINPDIHGIEGERAIKAIQESINWGLGAIDCKTCDTFLTGGKKHYNSLEDLLGANHWLVQELKREQNELRAYIAYEELGHAFHTTQDFFAHSNYIELMADVPVGTPLNAPVLVPNNFNQFNYAGIQNLIKSNPNANKTDKLESGYFSLTENYCNRVLGNTNPPGGYKYCHYNTNTTIGLNKDSDSASELVGAYNAPSHKNHLYAKDAATYVSALLWADFLRSLNQNPSNPSATSISNRITTTIPIAVVNNNFVLTPKNINVITNIPNNQLSPVKSDCLSYNPANLKIVNEGANGWLLTDGISRMVMLDNEQDAQAALAMAKQHTSQCFIGRDNKRTDRKNYIVSYWSGNSGIATVIPNKDCLPYDPTNLKIVDEGANGWLLTDGRSRMLMLDNKQDAQAALSMAKQYTKHCFIGRDNKRPDRKNYIIEYWE